jgi:hypothetical protein
LINEVNNPRNNSKKFLDKLRGFLKNSELSNDKLVEQLGFFNNKKYFDRSLLGRVENVLNFINDNTGHMSYSDLTKRHFKISDQSFDTISNKITDSIKDMVQKMLLENDLVSEIVSKPSLKINRLAYDNLTINDNERFKKFKKFQKISTFDMTKHSSIKINSILLIGKQVIVKIRDI